MKKSISLLILPALMIAGIISCGNKNPELPSNGGADSSKRTAMVTASTNLVIRTAPNRTATKLGVVGHGSTVEVLQDGDKEENIGGITARWYRVSFNGVEGWVFGGYLLLSGGAQAAPAGSASASSASSTMSETLAEEKEPGNYVGHEYLNLDPALKSRMISMIAVGSHLMTVTLKYDGRAVVILQKKTGMTGSSTRWLVTDVQPMAFNDKKELLFFPSSCSAKKISAPIMALARNVEKDCEYTKIISAWTIDESTGRFSPAMTGGISCRPDCCGDDCN